MATATPHHARTSTAPNEPAIPDDDVAQLSKDTAFQLVQNWRRREILHYLRDHDQADIGNLAELIAAKNGGISVAEVTSKQRKSVYVGLYQCHLPQLDREGVIEYNKDRGTVEKGSHFEELAPYLDDESSPTLDEQPRGIIAGLIAVAALATISAVSLGSNSASVLPLVAWGGVSTAGCLLIATHQVLAR